MLIYRSAGIAGRLCSARCALSYGEQTSVLDGHAFGIAVPQEQLSGAAGCTLHGDLLMHVKLLLQAVSAAPAPFGYDSCAVISSHVCEGAMHRLWSVPILTCTDEQAPAQSRSVQQHDTSWCHAGSDGPP